MPHIFTSLLSHCIFSTKDRVPHIDLELRPRLFGYMGGIIGELGGIPMRLGGVADHVHLLISLPPAVPTADALRVLKTNSSRWVHETWPSRRHFGWQAGYGAFSVSLSNRDEVARYIEKQEDHHRKLTFQDEFIAFLKRHGIAYDERYLWD